MSPVMNTVINECIRCCSLSGWLVSCSTCVFVLESGKHPSYLNPLGKLHHATWVAKDQEQHLAVLQNNNSACCLSACMCVFG